MITCDSQTLTILKTLATSFIIKKKDKYSIGSKYDPWGTRLCLKFAISFSIFRGGLLSSYLKRRGYIYYVPRAPLSVQWRMSFPDG